MDLNDFTSAENKKVPSENDIPTFTPPAGDAPKVGVDGKSKNCLLYTSDAADEEDSVDLGGRRRIQKKKKKNILKKSQDKNPK